MEIIFFGTSGMHPTKERSLFSIFFRCNNENILVDCGEGTQRQMRMINIPSTKITRIFLTHLHGDHINGLPGLIQNLQANQYNRKLEIYGPIGLKKLIRNIHEIIGGKLDVEVNEINQEIIFRNKDFYAEAMELEHSAKVYGYSFIENDKRKINMDYLKRFNLTKHILLGDLQRGKDIVYEGKKIKSKDATTLAKGKKLTIITDTRYCDNAVRLAKDSDVLVCESTYDKELKDKAKEYKHLTTEDAAMIAKKSKSKKLILTHFSQRYSNVGFLVKEARKIFKNAIDAKDFMKVEI